MLVIDYLWYLNMYTPADWLVALLVHAYLACTWRHACIVG